MLLSELLEQYTAKRLKSGSANTLRLYRHSINSFAKSLGRTPTIHDLTDEQIERHMWAVVSRGGAAPSANKDRGQLIALWRFAAEKQIVETWPDNRALPEPEIIPMGWMPHEVSSLFATIKSQTSTIGDVPASLWWSSLIRVLIDTGERIGAIRKLAKSALQDQWLLVPAHLRKGKKRDRLYALQDETIDELRKLIAANKSGQMLFPWDRCETYLYNRFKKLLEEAGLPTDRRSKFHRIRRTVASAVARQGGDASAALDHSSPRTTKKYLDPRIVGHEPTSSMMAKYLSDPDLAKRDRTSKESGVQKLRGKNAV